MKRGAMLVVCLAVILLSGNLLPAEEVAPGAATAPQSGQPAVLAEGQIMRSLTPVEALQMQQNRSDLVFLDVRTSKERSYGAIPGSTLVNIYDLLKGTLPLPKDKPILLVCAIGGRSYVAAQVMSQQGYREVYNLSGGIKAWLEAGLPIMQDPAYANQAGQ
jgi:rhodanese-related sulfurtransferase